MVSRIQFPILINSGLVLEKRLPGDLWEASIATGEELGGLGSLTLAECKEGLSRLVLGGDSLIFQVSESGVEAAFLFATYDELGPNTSFYALRSGENLELLLQLRNGSLSRCGTILNREDLKDIQPLK